MMTPILKKLFRPKVSRDGVLTFKVVCSLAVFFSVTYYCQVSQAQYLTGPVASALGGAGRAATEDGEQFIHNPAAVTQASQISSSLFYADGYNGFNQHDNYFGVTFTDNEDDNFFSGGYAYVHRDRTFYSQENLVEDYHQAVAGKFITNHISIGVNVNYLQSQIANTGTFVQWNGHFGVFYNPTPFVAFAFVAYNVMGRDFSVPFEVQENSKYAIGATYLFMPQLRGRLDISQQQVLNPENKLEYQAGIESRMSEFMLFRLGYDQDDLNEVKFWSFGFGFDGPRAKLDYFYHKNLAYGATALHGVDIRIPFW